MIVTAGTGFSFDSCILIDVLNGVANARRAISGAATRMLSVVARAEVLAGIADGAARCDFDLLLAEFTHVDVTVAIADAAAAIRRGSRLKLPDALILATARACGLPLLTRDAAFDSGDPGIVFPYRLDRPQ